MWMEFLTCLWSFKSCFFILQEITDKTNCAALLVVKFIKFKLNKFSLSWTVEHVSSALRVASPFSVRVRSCTQTVLYWWCLHFKYCFCYILILTCRNSKPDTFFVICSCLFIHFYQLSPFHFAFLVNFYRMIKNKQAEGENVQLEAEDELTTPNRNITMWLQYKCVKNRCLHYGFFWKTGVS